MGTAERATITYKNLPQDVKPGDSILLDDGLIGLKVEEVQGDTEIVCTVMNDGPISNHKGVNVPGVKLNLPFIDEKDHADIVYACEKGFDFIAASFVRSKEDVLQIREILKEHNSKIQIISKIELPRMANRYDCLHRPCVFRHEDGFLFRTPLFPGHRELCRKSNGGENKNA